MVTLCRRRTEMEAHVIAFPYPLQGHISPMFVLAMAMAKSGVRVTLVLPHKRYNQMVKNISSIRLLHVEAIADNDDGERNECDPADEHQFVERLCFDHSMKKLEAGLEELLRHRCRPSPTSLVSDTLMPWTQDLANRLSIPRFIFSVFSAAARLSSTYVPQLIHQGLLPFIPGNEQMPLDFIPGLPNFKLKDIPADFLGRDRRELEVILASHRRFQEAKGVLINTVYDLESESIDALKCIRGGIYPVGPLLSGIGSWWEDKDNENEQYSTSLLEEDKSCLSWLEKQAKASVVYVQFGTVAELTAEEMKEVAMGLEESGQAFLWVLNEEQRHNLPEGFEKRIEGRGKMVSWAPQMKVLSHPSVATLLFHGGSGSMLEALANAMPMIILPFVSDQNTIMANTLRWGVALAVRDDYHVPTKRSPVDPPLRDTLSSAINEMLHGEQGKTAKNKALHTKSLLLRAVSDEGSSRLAFQQFLESIRPS